MLKKIISLLSALIIVLSVPTISVYAAHGSTVGETQKLIDGIVEYKQTLSGAKSVQQLCDGALAREAGNGGQWYILSLSQYDKNLNFAEYRKALENHIKSGDEYNPVICQKNALALIATGYSGSLTGEILENTVGKLGIMSYIFALHLINNGVSCTGISSSGIVRTILDSRKPDGGWALNGSYSDTDVTAMAIQALAPMYSDKNVRQAVDAAVTLLAGKMTENGGFVSYGIENSESTAQVITALSCLGIDCTSDSRFIKNGKTLVDTLLHYRNEDGSYCHEAGGKSDYNATLQSLSAYVSLYMVKKGLGSYYIFDAKPQSESETTAKPALSEKTTAATTKAETTQKQTAAPTTQATTAKQSTASTTDKAAEQKKGGTLFDIFARRESTTEAKAASAAVTTVQTTAQTTAPTTVPSTAPTTTQITVLTTIPSTVPTTTQTTAQTTEQTTVPTTIQTTTQATTQTTTLTTAQTTQQAATQPPESTAAASSAATQTTVAAAAETQNASSAQQTFSVSEQTGENTDANKKSGFGIKPYIALAVIAAAAGAILLLHFRKKGGKITYLIICIAAAAALFLTFTVDIQSKNNYYKQESEAADGITVYLSIRCDTVAGQGQAPASGVILDKTEFTVEPGCTVYDVLIKAAKQYGIQIENSAQTPGDNSSAYISGINYLYEFSFGELSGWVYRVNSVSASVGCGAYELHDGDNVEFLYTCNLGEDIK
ncbi:MAG: DUF4430 domain-containing protein [Clostridia bacterium]|nr:DUF4430 domain-containing protein [Clostridia bacterium]